MIGWVERNGLWVNEGVESSSDALLRGGSLAFDPSTLGTVLLPWSDGSGDLFRHTPQLPDGVQVGSMEATDYGFRFPCTGALSEIAIVDSRDETMWGLHNGLGSIPGAEVIWTMPVSAVKDDGGGVWRPKRSTLSGCQFNVGIQPRSLIDYDEQGEVAGTRPEWAAGAAMIYGRGKQHNLLHADGSRDKCYMTGKLAQFPAHFACFWKDGRLVGRVTGWYEWDAAASQLVKCLSLAECMVFINAGAATVSIDDTLGYTSAGASSTGGGCSNFLKPVTAPSSFDVDSISVYSKSSSAAYTNAFAALYLEVAGVPSTPVTNSKTPDFTNPISTGSPSWNTGTYSAKPSLTASSIYWFMLSKGTLNPAYRYTLYYDAGLDSMYTNNTAEYDSLPNPIDLTSYTGPSSFGLLSLYLTYTPSAGGSPTAIYQYLLRKRRTT